MEDQKIFFSYSRLDASEFALKLAEDLRKAGANIWIDQLDIQGGKRWDTEIQNALKASQCVIFIVSEKSVESENVLDEVSYALNNRKHVIPLIISNCEVPYRASRLQQIDFTQTYETGVSRLKRALNLATERELSSAKQSEHDKAILDDTNLHEDKVKNSAGERIKEIPSSYLKDRKEPIKKRYLLIGVIVITVTLIAFLIISKIYFNPIDNGKDPPGDRSDTVSENKNIDTLLNTNLKITEEKENVSVRITLAKQYFDKGNVDSGTAILYNSKSKMIIKDEFNELFDSCLLRDYTCYYENGMKYYNQKKFISAIVFFSLAATSNSKAMCMLGNMYYSGDWVSINLEAAYSWYTQAERYNNSVAILMLGIFYTEGRIIPKNNLKAKQYFTRVISNNDNLSAKKIATERLKELE